MSPDGKYFFWSSTRSNVPRMNAARLTTTEYLKKLRSAGNGLGDIYMIDVGVLELR
jgi:hypothetical protein